MVGVGRLRLGGSHDRYDAARLSDHEAILGLWDHEDQWRREAEAGHILIRDVRTLVASVDLPDFDFGCLCLATWNDVS